MNFLVILPNKQLNVECPSDFGVFQFLGRFNLKAAVQPIIRNPKQVDLVLDEDGNNIHAELKEEWVT